MQSAVCPIRVGRDDEVEALRRNAAACRTTLVSGPAGIGKSRLSAEALVIASDLGLGALTGYCSQDQAVPYAPFVSAIRRRTRTMDDDALRTLFSGGALLSAALVPEAARTVGVPVEIPPQPDLFAAIWQLLYKLAGDNGAVLLLEDLHWADTDTLGLLTYLIREGDDLPVWLVGTYRGDEIHRRHSLAPFLARLAKERRFDEIVLQPLRRDEIATMIEAIFEGTEVGDAFVDAMFERTEGNPFFVEELLKVLIERGDFHEDESGWVRRELSDFEMPLTIRETLLARAQTLEPRTSALLHLAALAGDRIDLAALVVAGDASAEQVDAMVMEGLRLQLLVERREGGSVRFAFRHALTLEALGEEMIGPDRRRGHLALARAIEAVHAAELDAHAAALADHYLAGGDTAAAIQWGRRAAEVAASSFALDEAGRRYEQVLSMMALNDPTRIEVLLAAVTATIEAPDRRLGVALATEARSLAHEEHDRASEARALEALAVHASEAGETMTAVEHLRDALTVVHGADDAVEATILARLCRQLTRVDRIEEATSLVPAAVSLAERTSNHRALSSLHVTAMMNASTASEFDASLEAARASAQLDGDERSAYGVNQTAGYICLWRGELAESARSFERAIAHQERVAPHDLYTVAGYVWLLALQGRYDDALAHAVRARVSSAIPTRIVTLTGLYEVAERQGGAEAEAEIAELWSASMRTGESQRSVPALSARARYTLLTEGVEAADADFWDVLERTTSARGRGSHWLFSPDFAAGLLDAERIEELERWAEAVAIVTRNDPHVHNRAADALVRGRLGIARSEWEAASAALSEARELYGAMGCPAREVEVHVAVSELSSRLGDEAGALASAQAALGLATSIGASTLAELAVAASERAAVPTVLATILFTDIVRSTEHLSDVGDRSWTTVLARHDAVVRRELERFGGREVNTTGDGFVATFDSPARGIRCALALRDVLAGMGIEIRSGIHTGECQVIGDNVGGVAVHLAARVCAEAGASQVVVTSTVRELVVGAGFEFTDLGTRTLRGVPGEWHIFALGASGR